MKILIKIMLFLFIFLMPTYGSSAKKIEKFTSNDIQFIRSALLEKQDFYKKDGFFVDVHKIDIISKEEILKGIRENGYNFLFPDEFFSKSFFKYLDEINQKPYDYANRKVEYQFNNTDNIYNFVLIDNNEDITIAGSVLISTNYSSFPYSEMSFLYSFEKYNGKIVFSKLNVAG